MAGTAYMNYVIYFTDKAEYDDAKAVAGGNLINTSPAHAADLFGLDFPVPGGPLKGKGMYYFSPFTPGAEIGHPLPSGVFVDPEVDSINVPGQTDPFGNKFPDETLIWSGIITIQGNGASTKVPQTPVTPQPPPIPPPHVPPGTTPPPPPTPPGPPPQPPPVPISQRRWAIGFELPGGGETNGNPIFGNISREASRTAEGYGLAVRGPGDVYSMAIQTLTGLAQAQGSWERLYIRLRRLPSVNSQLWQSHSTPSDASGIALSITPTGAILVENNNSSNVRTTLTTTSVFTLNTWYRLDIVINYSGATGTAGTITIYRNGVVLTTQQVLNAAGGLGQSNSFHVRTELSANASTNGLEMDIDDWINSEIPSNNGAIDFVSGSHVMRVNPTGFAASHNAGWAGDYRVTLQNPAFSSTSRLVSTTGGARLAVTTDAAEGPITQFGVAAMSVGLYSSRVSNNGTLGYSLAGGAAVLSAITQSSSILFNTVLYRPAGLTPALPPPYPPNSPALASVFPIELYHEKGSGSGSSSVGMLMASMECLGAWGPEDGIYNDPNIPPIVRSTDIHNAPYVRYDLAGHVVAPDRSVAVIGGVYNGNSLGQDIALSLPPHLYWIRRVTGSSSGPHHWHSSALSASNLNSESINPEPLVRATLDLTGHAKIQISGNDPQINQTGDTYQYIAVCDPGMRYLLAGGFSHQTNIASAVNALQNASFQPDAAFLMLQTLGSNPSTAGLWYKGPGHAAATAQRVDQGETANTLTFGLGSLTSQGLMHPSTMRGGLAYAVLRMVDPDCPDQGVVFQILQYTGNGAGGNRVINLTPVSNRFPLLAFVLPHNGQGVFRDPSHTTVNSSQMNGTNVTTGITAGGVDQISVGTTLNANGVIYDVFVIPGSPFGWNNGTYIPVAPCSTCNATFPCPNPTPPPGEECTDGWNTLPATSLPYIPLNPGT